MNADLGGGLKAYESSREPEGSKVEFKDKFIAFIDVLGFKSMIEAAEEGRGRSLAEIREILGELGREKDKAFYQKYGPQVCPQSTFAQKDLDFQVTQVSDCAVVSAEVSPAGVINLVNHCWGAAIMLLSKGVMVRGYITRGRIYHQGAEFMGTGYHEAYRREAGVSAFKQEADEKGTPFVEVDSAVSDYVRDETDRCVREMFGRYVKADGDLTALFPFKRLAHSFAIGGFGVPPFDPEKEKANNENVRKSIHRMKARLMEHVDEGNAPALAKTRHYLTALDAQLAACDKTDEVIESLASPTRSRRMT